MTVLNPGLLDLAKLPPSQVHLPMFREIIDTAKVIDEDYRFFGLLRGMQTLFIDVGADIGAASLAALNLCGSVDVLAFEPNASLRWYLEEVAAVFARRARCFSYDITGLGDSEGTIELFIPKVDDWHVIGEASMDRSVFEQAIVVERLSEYSPSRRFSLDRAIVPITTFDAFGLDGYDVEQYDVVLVKIDVENYEPHVLCGMQRFIAENRPLFFVENSLIETYEILKMAGYAIFDFVPEQNKIRRVDRPGRVNMVCVHEAQLHEATYRQMIA